MNVINVVILMWDYITIFFLLVWILLPLYLWYKWRLPWVKRLIGGGLAVARCMFLIKVVLPFFHSTSDSFWKNILLVNKDRWMVAVFTSNFFNLNKMIFYLNSLIRVTHHCNQQIYQNNRCYQKINRKNDGGPFHHPSFPFTGH